MSKDRTQTSFANPTDKRLLGQRGQIVVEYLLLLSIAVVVAALITKTMVSHDPANPGFVLSAWSKIIDAIGADKADDINR